MQPVRRNIKEQHPDLIREEAYRTLLVDGGSLLFMSFADKTMNSDNVHIGGVYQFLLQLRIILTKGTFRHVYVFFDNEYSGYLRWELYKDYKSNRDKHYEQYGASDYWKQFNENVKKMQSAIFSKKEKKAPHNEFEKFVDENFDRERDILCRYFEELYIRWYIDDIVEGDDLISYYCQNKEKNEKIIIISGDMDLMQLISEDIAIYELHKKTFITKANFSSIYGFDSENVLTKKIFCGDKSDNIGNIKGLSEDGFFKLMPEAKKKPVTIEDVKRKASLLNEERKKEKKAPLKLYENILNGVSNKKYDGDFYEINKKIIDLKRPLMSKGATEEMESMMHVPIDPDGRSMKNLYEYILSDKIEPLMGNTAFAAFFSPFKALEEREKDFFSRKK